MDHARHQRPASILGLSRKDLRSRLRGQSEERAFFVRTRLRNVRTVSAEPGKKKGKADQRIARSCESRGEPIPEPQECLVEEARPAGAFVGAAREDSRDLIEIVRCGLDAGITLDQFEDVDEIGADVVQLSIGVALGCGRALAG